jgi:hypothetical protein
MARKLHVARGDAADRWVSWDDFVLFVCDARSIIGQPGSEFDCVTELMILDFRDQFSSFPSRLPARDTCLARSVVFIASLFLAIFVGNVTEGPFTQKSFFLDGAHNLNRVCLCPS